MINKMKSKDIYGLIGSENVMSQEEIANLAKYRTGDAELDSYISFLGEALSSYENIDPRSKEQLESYMNRIDRFLEKYAGITYSEFVNQADPQDIRGNDFNLIDNPRLKRRLFEFRAKLYLTALDSWDQKGLNLENILEKIKSAKIPYIKKEETEPTFERILEILR